MLVTWEQKVLAMSLEHRYMLEQVPDSFDAPPHPHWQCPFVFAPKDETWERLQARVRRAGELWLINPDFRPYEELLIAHVELPWFMGFQRAIRPDRGHIVIGPLDRRVLRPSDGAPLFGFPLVFRENGHASGRDVWQQLAGRA